MTLTRSDVAWLTVTLDVTLTTQEGGRWKVTAADLERFGKVCTALIQASAPNSMTLQDAEAVAGVCAERILRNPDRSFEDAATPERADRPQVFFSYALRPYGREDAVRLSMTLVFPRAGADAPAELTPPPDYVEATPPPSNIEDGGDAEWVGYYPDLGDETHFEIFLTPTPEPDSAVYH